MQKQALALFFCMCVFVPVALSQKFGYIDSEYILRQMPEYVEAQQMIEQLAITWEGQVKTLYVEIDAMYNKLNSEKILLTEDMYEERMQEIKDKEKAAAEFNTKIFGINGLYFLKKEELMKFVQDKVFASVEKVAKQKRLQIVFDKASDIVMIYTDPRHDYSDFVLEELEIKQGNEELLEENVEP